MTYNPDLQRWEGNEDALVPFSHPNTSTSTVALTTASTPTFAPPNPPPHAHDRSHSVSRNVPSAHKHVSSPAANVAPSSPARAPALISHISAARGVQVERGMVFDPHKMCWLKLDPSSRPGDPRPSLDGGDDDDDPFAGLEDLKDDQRAADTGAAPPPGGPPGDAFGVDEVVFVGEEFDVGPSFVRRQREEESAWRRRVDGWTSPHRDDRAWRWAVRDLATLASAATARS